MTATQVHPTPPPVVTGSQPVRRRSRALPNTIGAVLAIVGAAVALGGGGLLAVAGDDGTIGSGTHDVSTSTSALVSQPATFEDMNDVASAIGQPRIGIKAEAKGGGGDVFIGVGPRAAVDKYLAGVSYDTVTDADVDPFVLDRDTHAGTKTPAPPAGESFWVARSSGQTAEIDWKVRDGDYRIVVMNADGSTGVATDSHLEVGAQYLSTIALAVMLGGLAALAAGIVLLTRPPGYGRPKAATVRPAAV